MKKISKKGQLTLGDAPTVVLLVGLVFLVMATIAFIGEKYGDALTDGSVAQNVTNDLNTEISNNTSIAGIVLTISLVGIVLTILIGVFIGVRGGTSRV
ncbi:MAG: hypothetical protein WC758_08240 [Candidatus Woesearchaeota archaeon]|jgi:hypothetical protein